MNCRRFNFVMHEYLEGTLSPRKLALAERHLVSCAECRQAVRREQSLADSLSTLLRHNAESLTLRPHVRQQILRALQNKRASTTGHNVLAGLWRELAWPKFAAAGLGIFIVLLGLSFLAGVLPRDGKGRTRAVEDHSPVSIQMSYFTPHYTFRQAGNLIIDSLISRTNFVNVTVLTPDTKQSPQDHQKRISPL